MVCRQSFGPLPPPNRKSLTLQGVGTGEKKKQPISESVLLAQGIRTIFNFYINVRLKDPADNEDGYMCNFPGEFEAVLVKYWEARPSCHPVRAVRSAS